MHAHNDEKHPTPSVHYVVEDDFAIRYVRIYLNSRAELVTLAPGLLIPAAFIDTVNGKFEFAA